MARKKRNSAADPRTFERVTLTGTTTTDGIGAAALVAWAKARWGRDFTPDQAAAAAIEHRIQLERAAFVDAEAAARAAANREGGHPGGTNFAPSYFPDHRSEPGEVGAGGGIPAAAVESMTITPAGSTEPITIYEARP
jgi:hypothetical protein